MGALGRYWDAWGALPRAQLWFLLALAAGIGLALIDQPFPEVAPLHHIPTVIAILAAPGLLKHWPLSTAALTCIVAFLALHTLGGRYTYTMVPYDAWSEAVFGTAINDLFGWERNHYDRLVHLLYGALAVAPVAEFYRRHRGIAPGTAGIIAILFVLATGALYEMVEWLLTLVAAGATADAYNGQQGDIWDAQKDMALAFVGALAALAFALRRRP